MTNPNEPRSPKSVNNLPPGVVWSVLGLALAAFVGLGIYYARKSHSKAARAQPPAVANPLPEIIAAGAVELAEKANPESLGWRFFPKGLNVVDGTTFFLDGAIRTGGLEAALGKRYPGAVLDMPVNRRGSRIHLLQSPENSSRMPPGAPYAHFVLHYADGKTHTFDLNFGVHGWDWFRGRNEPEKEVRDENTRIGWEIQRPDGLHLRMYHTILENPFPDVVISSFDVIQPLYRANVLLYGFTVDNDSRPLAPTSEGWELAMGVPPPQSITFLLQDAAGKPLPEAKLSWTAVLPRGRIHFPPFKADAQGQVKIEAPPGSLVQIHYRASGLDGKQASGVLRLDDRGLFPEKQVVELQAGTDNDGGAVVLSEKAYLETQSWGFLPYGPNVLDGTTFFIDGGIRTGGLSQAGDGTGRRFPGAIWEVPVNRRGSRIHLLQGAEHAWKGMPTGAPYAHFVLHYADGKTHTFDLNFGIHGWDWGSQENKPEEEVLDKNTRIVWTTPRPPGWPKGLKELRLWHTILENPFPDVTIVSFDVSSGLYAANLQLFGFTVDNDPRPLAPVFNSSELPIFGPPPQRITFTLQDAAGKLLPDARLSWTAVANRGRIYFPGFKADALGQVKIEVPRGNLVQILYQASTPAGKAAAGALSLEEGGLFPEKQTVELAP